MKKIISWFLTFVFGVVVIVIAYIAITNNQVSDRDRELKYEASIAPDTGRLITFDSKAPKIGSRLHCKGQMWLVTKVVLQDSETWVNANRQYYREHPGPREESNNTVKVETVLFDDRYPPRFAIWGLTLD